MTDSDCVTFLQEMLPRLGLRWRGFRKVRRQVCQRLQRRLRALDLPDLNAYRSYLSRLVKGMGHPRLVVPDLHLPFLPGSSRV